MRIISWNCNGAFRKKFDHLLNFKADLYVIQECENPAASHDKKYTDWAVNYLWTGDTKNKGLGIFAKKDIALKKLNWSDIHDDMKVKHLLPCIVNGQFQLIAVWTHQNNSYSFGYIGQLWKYLQINKDNFKETMIAGDFNSNAIWDRKSRHWNHTDVVNELMEMKMESLYHKFTKEAHGKEKQPTFYLHRNLSKPYHIDYCFASASFYDRLKRVKVGSYKEWKHLSDHAPLFITLSEQL